MGSLRIGLGQSITKVSQLRNEDRSDDFLARGRRVNLAQGSRRLRRRLSLVASGAVDGLAVNSDRCRLDDDVAVRKRSLDKEDAVSGKVDKWIRESVQEIVSNIEEAPFLVHIYPGGDQGSSQIVREKAEENRWPNIKDRWEGGSSIPNGIALVEELEIYDDDNVFPEETLRTVGNDSQHRSSTKVFGIVIQERGLSCPACYILKTSIVRSVTGTCTHFCIFRSECFGETADVQLKKQWLL